MMKETYAQRIVSYQKQHMSFLNYFALWRELVLDVAAQPIQATNEFCKTATGWQQIGEESEVYFSPARAQQQPFDVEQEAVYVMGCILYETLFWKTLWRANKIRSCEQLITKPSLFKSEEQDVTQYILSTEQTANELRFVFQLLEAMVAVDAAKRPASLQQVASWLRTYDTGNATIYYAKQEEDVDATPYVGIDLGTTNSVVVLAQRGQLTELRIDDALTVPSAVFYEDEETYYFGKKALSRGVNHPQSLATSFKRHMQGVDGHYPNLKYAATGEDVNITGMQIAQMYMTWLREQAMKVTEQPLNHAVITVPSDFDSRKIDATRRAALGAGFTHVGIEREPNAAGYAYLYAERKVFTGMKNIFVYDFGGGTFDISILQRTGEQAFDIIGRDGNEHLGGDLLNQAISEWIVEQVRQEYFDFELDPYNYADEQLYYNAKKIILDAANEAKHALSTKEVVQVKLRQLPISDDNIVPLAFELTRRQFEELIESYIDQANEAIERAMGQAEQESGLTRAQIDEVVLAGGTSLIPAIKSSVEAYFGKVSNKSLNMSTMIARGAALFAMLKWTENKEQSIIQQAAINKVTHDFGVAVADSRHLAFKMLIPARTTLPCQETASFSTEKDDQQSLQVIIGRRSMHARTANYFNDEAIEVIDKIIIPNLPKANAGDLRIDVTFQFDSIGNLAIAVQVCNRAGEVLEQKELLKYADLL